MSNASYNKSNSMPVLNFKRGDDLKLDMTVQDTNNAISLGLLETLNEAKEALERQMLEDSTDTTAITALQNAVDVAQNNYDASIIVDITGWTIRSQVRYVKTLVDDLDIVTIDATLGIFALTKAATSTANWKTKELTVDVEFVRPEGKVSSETFIINVLEDQTI